MFKLIKVFVLALLIPVSANANFHSGTEEENERLSRLIMQYGEIIHSADMKFLGKELIGSVVYHVRIKKPNRMELLGVPEGIYLCFVGLDPDDNTIMECKKL